MYWPLTGAFMNVSAVTLRLLLIITAYMDDLLHEDTNIFFLSITRIIFLSRIIELSNFNHTEYRGRSRIFFFVPNYRIIEFLSSHGISRTVTDFHFFLFLSRIIELSNFNHTEYRGQSRIFFFSSCHELSNYRILSFCPETCPLSRIIELSNFCLP